MLESRPALTLSSEIVSRARWQDQRSSMLTIKVMTKPCPKCRIPTERDGGCMHMECSRCNFQWCWLCQSMVNKPILLNKVNCPIPSLGHSQLMSDETFLLKIGTLRAKGIRKNLLF